MLPTFTPSSLSHGLILCGLTLISSFSKGDTPTPETESALRVVSVDFYFDGGSLKIEFEDAKQVASLLKLIVPGSLIRDRLGVSSDEPLFLYARKGEKPVRITPQQLRSLSPRLMRWEGASKLHSAVTATLLAIQAGHGLQCYDAEAVEALEAGNWMKLFKYHPPADPDEDPFGDSTQEIIETDLFDGF